MMITEDTTTTDKIKIKEKGITKIETEIAAGIQDKFGIPKINMII